MKRIIGIIGVAAISMLLGLSVGYAREEKITLVSTSPSSLIDDFNDEQP